MNIPREDGYSKISSGSNFHVAYRPLLGKSSFSHPSLPLIEHQICAKVIAKAGKDRKTRTPLTQPCGCI